MFKLIGKKIIAILRLEICLTVPMLCFRRFGTKCAGCSLGISPSDLVRRARNKVFHLKCFTCMMCRKELSTGEELYILDENKFICKEDYISSKLSGKGIKWFTVNFLKCSKISNTFLFLFSNKMFSGLELTNFLSE